MCSSTPSQHESPSTLSISSSTSFPLHHSLTGNVDSQQDRQHIEVACQTNLICITDLQWDNQALRSEIAILRGTEASITPDIFVNNPKRLKFYTGLPNWTIFNAVMTLVCPLLLKLPNRKLSTFVMLVIFFMRIRIHLYEEDIGHRFNIHH